jgi:hypothetical protein
MADEFETRRDDDPDTGTFGIGDLFSKVVSEGLPANARAYLETAVRHNLDLPNANFGNEFFTEKQLERLREIIENRTSDEVNWWAYPPGNLKSRYKRYEGPLAETLGIGSLLQKVYNDEPVLETSLGSFLVVEGAENYYIYDPFDFSGIPRSLSEAVEDASDYEENFAYEFLRSLAPNMSRESETFPDDKPPPVFQLTIPKEGPIPRGPVPTKDYDTSNVGMEEGNLVETSELIPELVSKAHGGFIDKPLYSRS